MCMCVCINRKDSGSRRRGCRVGGEREPELLSLKMQVFTGSNGLCHHYATTVRCRLAAVTPEPHPLH